MRPTNCGRIVSGSMGDPIHGPLEAVLTPCDLPLGYAKAHGQKVYRLMGGTPDTVPSDLYLWPAPHSNDQYVRVVMETT